MNKIVEQFCNFYKNFNQQKLEQLNLIYSDNISFIDPAHQIGRLENLNRYFSTLMQQVSECRFVINKVMEDEGEAFIQWQMIFSHHKLNNNTAIKVEGVSHIRFSDKIYYHRDYFDLGSMLYEHLPLLGFIIKKIKSRLAHE